MVTRKKNKAAVDLPAVSVSEGDIARYLHLGTPWVQGSMRLKDPYMLDLEYVQRMVAWLLFTPAAEDLTALQAVQVRQADAGEAIRHPDWQGAVHALQVDLYDHEAAAPVLDSAEFYADCRAMLTPEGCMTVNLFGRRSSYARSLEKICTAFGAENVWAFKPTREGNTIVLALRVAQPHDVLQLQARAQAVQAAYQLPATKWVKVLRPVAESAPG